MTDDAVRLSTKAPRPPRKIGELVSPFIHNVSCAALCQQLIQVVSASIFCLNRYSLLNVN